MVKKYEESFVFYRSFYEAILDIDDKNKLLLFNAICEFSLNKTKIELSGTAKTLFKLIEPQLSANLKKRSDGRKGGRKKTSGSENKKPVVLKNKTSGFDEKEPNENENVNENENENVNINDLVKPFGKIQPSPIEISNLKRAVKMGCTQQTVINLIERKPSICNFNQEWAIDELIAQKHIDDKEAKRKEEASRPVFVC